MTKEQAYNMLRASYMTEVTYRRKNFNDDAETKKNIMAVAKILTDDNSKCGIMLCGLCGNGKTTMLRAFQNLLNFLISTGYVENNKGIAIEEAKHIVRISKDWDSFDKIRKEQMLGIEDMGEEPAEVLSYGNISSPLIDLLEYRYNNQLFTFITTNMPMTKIRDKYGLRIVDRLSEMLDLVVFENNSYRKNT
jgi:DNA replication protein DnaC